jgi:CHC2 zinc finger/Toprim domain
MIALEKSHQGAIEPRSVAGAARSKQRNAVTSRHSPEDEITRLKATTSLARLISETLKLQRNGRVHVALCPFHGERTPSFTIYPDHFHCFGCGAHGDVIDWLMHTRRLTFLQAIALLGSDIGSTSTFQPGDTPPRAQSAADDRRNLEKARNVWQEATPPGGTLGEYYLFTRGLALPEEPVLRFHPSCPCGADRRPAMVALMTDPVTGEERGIHRTFLQPDGTGKLSKMMLGPAGVIRLCERITSGLGLAEGIETALAVAQRVQWGPVWAAGSAWGIARFPVLIQTTLNIFADCDDLGVGLKAARECANRWADAGAEVLIHLPPEGKDWDKATLGDVAL